MLHFGRRDVARIESFDVGEVIRELQPMLRQLFDPSVRIGCDVGNVAHTIAFDRAQFELFVLNIAANANQAMPDGGEFHVALDRAANGDVESTLRDTGHGMDDSVRERIFEAFFTTKPSGEGTGLGLAVAADVIAAAGGGVPVESAPDRGATVRIRLPAASGAGGSGTSAQVVPAAVPEVAA
jgi:signal transduction histidine kinase